MVDYRGSDVGERYRQPYSQKATAGKTWPAIDTTLHPPEDCTLRPEYREAWKTARSTSLVERAGSQVTSTTSMDPSTMASEVRTGSGLAYDLCASQSRLSHDVDEQCRPRLSDSGVAMIDPYDNSDPYGARLQ